MMNAIDCSSYLFKHVACIIKKVRSIGPKVLSEEERVAFLSASNVLHLAFMWREMSFGAILHMSDDALRNAEGIHHVLRTAEQWSDESIAARQYWRHVEVAKNTINGLLAGQVQLDSAMGVTEHICESIGSRLCR